MLELVGIKTNNKIYITDNVDDKSYFNSALGRYYINDAPPVPAKVTGWYVIDSELVSITQQAPAKQINKRFVLKDTSFETDKIKPVYLWDDVFIRYDDEDESRYIPEFDVIKSLYKFAYDESEPTFYPIEFKYTEILQLEVDLGKTFSYKRTGEWQHQNYPNVTDKDVKYGLIDKLITPKILLETKPVTLTQKETYDIIRAHIKDNIDPKYAEVTSDYDFCFTVKKRLALARPYSYQIDTNNSIFDKRKRKPKMETRWHRSDSRQIFEMAPKPYEKYTVITAFSAENVSALKEYIDAYLADLMYKINKPLMYCNCCNGTGIEEIKPV